MDGGFGPGALAAPGLSGAPRLSVLLCVRDEAERIPPLLAALSFADEVILVADRSTDGTVGLASRLGAVVVEGAWPLEGDRKRAGLEAALGEWVLELDADEMPDAELVVAVRRVVSAPGGPDYYQVRIDNHVGGRLIRHGWGGSFGTSSAVRLYRRGAKSWGPQRVHPRVRFTGLEGSRLPGALRHDVDTDVSDMLARLDRYSRLHAADLRESGKLGGVPRNLLRAASRFYKAYVRRRGWREGHWGFLIALMAALYPLLATLRGHLERPED
ncbi:glycosyltransferase family 2 protein [Roseomonas nepalensis]|uniref:Glycosyltransferase family 2 protein n=1 Tax=Muricoccus nepalensis TaxID=1854500 RepID=A0A502G1E4_9PROT|nr:glycosyltransferase family 2 protein [Roseomonas nepalensis]TPG55678.1 glycosyltransferase family 2 protein [Roseomonas nepalensis]